MESSKAASRRGAAEVRWCQRSLDIAKPIQQLRPPVLRHHAEAQITICDTGHTRTYPGAKNANSHHPPCLPLRMAWAPTVSPFPRPPSTRCRIRRRIVRRIGGSIVPPRRLPRLRLARSRSRCCSRCCCCCWHPRPSGPDPPSRSSPPPPTPRRSPARPYAYRPSSRHRLPRRGERRRIIRWRGSR